MCDLRARYRVKARIQRVAEGEGLGKAKTPYSWEQGVFKIECSCCII